MTSDNHNAELDRALDTALGSTKEPEPPQTLRAQILAEGLDAISSHGRAQPALSRPKPWGAKLWDWINLPVTAPHVATWALMALLGLLGGYVLESEPVNDEELFAYFGSETTLWAEELGFEEPGGSEEET